jgi:hypothetical protein
MNSSDLPNNEKRIAHRSNAELSLYDNLVKWYTEKSEGVHKAALAVILILLIVELLGFIVSPPYMMKLATYTGCSIEGYNKYTPTIWLAGVFTGLVLYFLVRYSHATKIQEWAGRKAASYIFPRWAQYVILVLTVGVVVLEIILIMFTKATISSVSRGAAIANPWLYWLGGLAAAFVVFVITDLKRLPRIVKFSLALWVAILTHIFWWITPVAVPVSKFWG